MTSKTFKSTMTDSRELEVDVIFSNPRLLIKESGNGRSGFVFAPSDAPALALAILEAAGVEATPMATSVAFGTVVADLQRLIAEQERATAEARERAELKAEALELFKASGAYGSDRLFLKFSDLEETTQSAWLAVARRARELAKEATK